MKHAFLQLLVRLVERSLSNDKDQVDMLDNLVLMVPDNLFNQPSHPVADNRIADLLLHETPTRNCSTSFCVTNIQQIDDWRRTFRVDIPG